MRNKQFTLSNKELTKQSSSLCDKLNADVPTSSQNALLVRGMAHVAILGFTLGLYGRGFDTLVPNELVADGLIREGAYLSVPLLYFFGGGLERLAGDDSHLEPFYWGAYALGVSAAYVDTFLT